MQFLKSDRRSVVSYACCFLAAICGLMSVWLGYLGHGWHTYFFAALALVTAVQLVRLGSAGKAVS